MWLIIFLVLLIVLFFIFLVLLLVKILKQHFIQETRHLDELNQDYLKKEEEAERYLAEARQKSQEIVQQAQQDAERMKDEIISKVQEEKDRVIAVARQQAQDIIQQADKTRQMLLSEINERVAKEAIVQACNLIQDTLPDEFKQDVHAHWVQELIKAGFLSLERLRIPQDIQEVGITSAFSLSEEQKKSLLKNLKDVLKRDITLKEKVDFKIVAGIVIHIGDLVLDGSLKNKIQERSISAQREGQE
jgi:F-type H+-transporting ATPase subunit delta